METPHQKALCAEGKHTYADKGFILNHKFHLFQNLVCINIYTKHFLKTRPTHFLIAASKV